MKETMKKYFDKFYKMWEEYNGSLPQISYNEDIDSRLYVGEMDEEEYISWKAREKNITTDLSELEDNFGVKFHKDIINYFNSYWFLELIGFCGEHNISLFPVIPSAETAEFEMGLSDYYDTNGMIDFIPLGFDSSFYKLIVVENETGKVFLMDTESRDRTFFYSTIEEMISNISFKQGS